MHHGVTEPERLGTTTLPDGRSLAWAEWGPPAGRPVLYVPGAGTSGSLGFGADVLPALDARLIALDRPGLGRSDPDPGRTLSTWVDDVQALAAYRALNAPLIAAFSQGAPFAYACAARGFGARVAIVAGQDDFANPLVTARLPAEVAQLVAAVASDPDGVEATFAATADAATMWELVSEMSSPADRAFFTAAPFAVRYRRALDEGFGQGGAGYARDFVLAFGAWPFDVGTVPVPVDLWYGGCDTSTVHSPDFGEALAQRIPTATRHFLPDAGSALLWTHSEAILRALLVS